MLDVKFDLFPATVTLADGSMFSNARVVATSTRAFLFGNTGQEITLLATADVADYDPGRGTLTLTDGGSWTARRAGGCGCGSILRRTHVTALLALADA